ncbi:MAG: hypothetical protein GXO76_15065 [Calditrichaeota bacterium]|nr:hypothetical protein [Calditrichota bacterium]
MSRRVKWLIIILVFLTGYFLLARDYMVVHKHTFKEWLVFSSNPNRIGKKAFYYIFPSQKKPEKEIPKKWNRTNEWHRYAQEPVLTIGAAGSWDEDIASFSSVLKDSVNFKMYYSGRQENFMGAQVGLAESNDGKHWKKYAGNPVLKLGPRGSWDDKMIWCPMVWKEGVYHMIYTGRSSKGTRQIGYATSTDGIHWKKSAHNPVFNDPTWAHNHTEAWGIIKVDDLYFLWYNTLGVDQRQVGLALSRDLVHWKPFKNAPIFSSEPGTDRYRQFCVFPFRYGPYFYMLIPSQDQSKNYAVFRLYRCKNPYFLEKDREFVKKVLLPGKMGQWDDYDLDTPLLLTTDITRSTFYNNKIWMYYSGEGGDGHWKEGLVIEPDIDHSLQMPQSLEKK